MNDVDASLAGASDAQNSAENVGNEQTKTSTTYDKERARAIFEEKTQRKIERSEHLSEKFAAEAAARDNYVHKMGEIMAGNPIKIGHHSERGHRRDLEKMHSNIEKSIEAREKSKYYEHRAELAKNPRAISSDDPDAIEKLQAAITWYEERATGLKNVDLEVLRAKYGNSWPGGDLEDCRRQLITGCRTEIRRLKKRVEDITAVRAMPDVNEKIGDAEIITDKELNRVQIFFPGKPSEAIRSDLKSYGFKWAPSQGAWQNFLNERSLYSARFVLKKHNGTIRTEPQIVAVALATEAEGAAPAQ